MADDTEDAREAAGRAKEVRAATVAANSLQAASDA